MKCFRCPILHLWEILILLKTSLAAISCVNAVKLVAESATDREQPLGKSDKSVGAHGSCVVVRRLSTHAYLWMRFPAVNGTISIHQIINHVFSPKDKTYHNQDDKTSTCKESIEVCQVWTAQQEHALSQIHPKQNSCSVTAVQQLYFPIASGGLLLY